MVPAAALKPGDTFERYTIEAAIGEGGMGCVYRAFDPRLGRRVALKLIAGDPEHPGARARLVREARAAAALDHANAVSIFDVGEEGATPYIVMELVEGRTLRAAIGDASVSTATRLAQLADAARALGAAHRRGLVHRDVKPDNVMVRDDGAVKVLDFGIARLARGEVDPTARTQTPALSTLTAEGLKLGTPVYMAPEQIRGDALDGRTDQFAWGVVAYEVLTGRLPWRGGDDALAVTASILTDAPDRAPLGAAGVPPAAQDAILRALSKTPADRFASMEDLLVALVANGKSAAGPARAPSATEAQQFSTREVEQVLGKAVDNQAKKVADRPKLGFSDLVSVAADVGVGVEALREASRELRRPDAPAEALPLASGAADAEARAWLRLRRKAFYRHAGVYVIVNAAVMALGLGILTFTPFWIWLLPAVGWGVGVAIHGLVALTTDEDDARRWQSRRARRGLLPMGTRVASAAVAAEAHFTRERRERRRLRVDESMTTPDHGAEDEAARAEDEAAAEDAREPARRRR